MTLNEFHETLDAQGYRFGANHLVDSGVDWYAWKTADGAENCDANDKPPSICIHPYQINVHGNELTSCEISIVADAGQDTWCNFKIYSVPLDRAINERKTLERLLVSAWNSAKFASQVMEPRRLGYNT